MLLWRLSKILHAEDLPLPKHFLQGSSRFSARSAFTLGSWQLQSEALPPLHSPACLCDLQLLPHTTLYFKPTVITQEGWRPPCSKFRQVKAHPHWQKHVLLLPAFPSSNSIQRHSHELNYFPEVGRGQPKGKPEVDRARRPVWLAVHSAGRAGGPQCFVSIGGHVNSKAKI